MEMQIAAPRPTELEPDAILGLAERVATGLKLQPGGDLDEAIGLLGGTIKHAQWGVEVQGDRQTQATLVVHEQGRFEIRVPDDVGRIRRRYLLAHELGHYFVHYPLVAPKPMEANYKAHARAELEANVFAGGLLVPTAALKTAIRDHHGILVDVARYFAVSLDLVNERVKAAVVSLG